MDIDVPIPRYIEQAILEPARDLLMEQSAENVRLSVLLPDEDTDGTTWFMPWAAGHTLTGKAKYDEPIAETLSRHAYESGDPRHWRDVTADSGFKQNPEASATIRTMFSLPVKYGEHIMGFSTSSHRSLTPSIPLRRRTSGRSAGCYPSLSAYTSRRAWKGPMVSRSSVREAGQKYGYPSGRVATLGGTTRGEAMGTSSEKSSGGSSREYERLLKGEITSKQYVQTLRKEARTQVARQRSAAPGRVAKRSSAA